MDALKEELNESKYQDGVRIRIMKTITSLDKFFESLESNPDEFMDRNKMDICDYIREVEKEKCIRKVVVFKSRLEELYKEFAAFQLELMDDKLYSEIQESILQNMSNAISGYYELIEKYEEDIMILGFNVNE